MSEKEYCRWTLETLRFSSFVPEDVRADRLESWLNTVTGTAPLYASRNPVSCTATARIADLGITLMWQPGRVDWHMHRADKPDLAKGIGGAEQIPELIRKYVMAWFALPDCPASCRLAIGAICNLTIQSQSEGNKIIGTLLKNVAVDPENTRDFFYRINKPTCIPAFPHGKVNRLASWSVQQQQIVVTVHGPEEPLRFLGGPDDNHCA